MSKLLTSAGFSSHGSGRHTPKQMTNQESIIHRSTRMVLMSSNLADEKNKKEHEEELKKQGWNSAYNQQYQPYGDMEEVFEGFSAVKDSLEQPIKQQETQLRIRMYKHMPQLSTKPPQRTLAILHEHQDQLKEMRDRQQQQQEKKKGKLKTGEKDEKEQDPSIKASGNEMLFTPSLKNLAQTSDGSKALKQEVLDSNLRLKAVRHGMRIIDVAPPHKEDYYIPLKKNYQPPHRPGAKDSRSKLAKSATRHNRTFTLSNSYAVHESSASPRSNQLHHSLRQPTTQHTPLAHSMLSPGSVKQTGGSFFLTDVKSGHASTRADTSTKMPSLGPLSGNNRGASLELGTTIGSVEHSKATSSPRHESVRHFGLQSILEPLVLSGRLSLKKHQKVMRSIESNTLPVLDNSMSSAYSRRPLRGKEAKKIGQLKEKFLSQDKVKVLPTEWLPGEGEDDMRYMHAQTKEVSLVDNKPVPSYINLTSLKDFLKREKPKMLGSSIQTQKKEDLLFQQPEVNYHEQLLHIIEEYQNPVDRKKLRKNPLALRMSVLFDPGYSYRQQMQEQAQKAKMESKNEAKGEAKTDGKNTTKSEETNPGDPESPKGHDAGKGSGEQSVVMLPTSNNVAFQEHQFVDHNQDIQQIKMNQLASETFGSNLKDNFATMYRLMGGDQTLTSMPGDHANTPSKSQSRLQKLIEQQEMKTLEKGGYYAGILRELFNPTDKTHMSLDSVFQLKNLCKDYYYKKKEMRAQLVSQLDVMAKDRPKNIQMKRKFFKAGDYSKNIMLDIDCMRMLAEVERVGKFKQIAQRGALLYSRVLRRVVDQEIKLVPMVFFIADYLKRLVENGIRVEREHIWRAHDIVRAGGDNSKELENFVCLVIEEIEELDQ